MKQPKQLQTKQKPIRNNNLKSKLKKKAAPFLFLAPSLIGVILFVLVPFMDAVRRSFYEAMSGKFVGFENYATVLSKGAFHQAVSNTLRFLVWCIPLLLAISLLLAVLLNSLKDKGKFFKTSFLIPMAIPVASVVLLWKVFFDESGLINGLIQLVGGNGWDWMNTDKAFYVLVFSYVWKNAGYDMVLWLAGLSGISPSLYEAAQLDGANAFCRFWYITLPSILPTVFIISVLSLLNSFKVFREAYLIAGDYPTESIFMLQHLFNNWFVNLDIQKMCAAAVMVAIFIMVLIVLLQKFWGSDKS